MRIAHSMALCRLAIMPRALDSGGPSPLRSLVRSSAIASVPSRRLIRVLPGRPACLIDRFDARLLQHVC